MKTLIVVYSYHHNNTQKVAEVFAKVLDAQIETPQQINPEELQDYDLVGFGSGIDTGKNYKARWLVPRLISAVGVSYLVSYVQA
jgi:flavodoxin